MNFVKSVHWCLVTSHEIRFRTTHKSNVSTFWALISSVPRIQKVVSSDDIIMMIRLKIKLNFVVGYFIQTKGIFIQNHSIYLRRTRNFKHLPPDVKLRISVQRVSGMYGDVLVKCWFICVSCIAHDERDSPLISRQKCHPASTIHPQLRNTFHIAKWKTKRLGNCITTTELWRLECIFRVLP